MRVVFLVGVIHFSFLYAASAPTLKIKVGSHLQNVFVTGSDLQAKSFSGKSARIKTRGLKLDCSPSRYYKSTSNQPVWAEVSSPSGVINWQGKHLAGKLQLVVSDKSRGRCHLVSEMLMEDYLSQVLSKEMHPSWPIEALKAQAVVARTYAYFKIENNIRLEKWGKSRGYDLENSEMDQVMGTITDRSAKTRRASIDTAGEILVTKEGKIQEAFFHSKCGGQTLTPEQVWGGTHMKGYKQVQCPFCYKHGKKNWKRSYSKSYVDRLLKSAGYAIPGKYSKKDYLTMNLGKNQTSFKKTALRKVLGRSRMPSHNYLISESKSHITLHGKGHGHGVGMCQFGAFEMAKKGLNYRQILGYYFPLMKLKKAY